LNDLKNSSNNGLKQLMNLFINLKEYEINDFISTYNKIDRNETNNSEDIQSYHGPSFKTNNQNYFAYKIDYLATHTLEEDKILNKDNVQSNIKKILDSNKGNIYQHSKHPEIISFLDPLISMDEINEKIFKTYTKLKPFTLEETKSKRELKIKKLVHNNFKKYDTRTKEDLFKTIKFIFETFNEVLYFRIRDNKLECSYHLYNLENNIDWLKNVKTIDNKSIDEGLNDIMNSRNKAYYTLKTPHFLPANNCLLDFDSHNYFEGSSLSYIKEIKEMIEFTIQKFKNIPDSDILINRKDFPLITKDNKYSYEHLLVGDQAKISGIDNFYFFGSQSIKDTNLDLPIPSAEEWKNIKDFKNIKWEDKKSIAFFRGSSSGCGQTIKTNPRFHLADLSYQWSKLEDKKNLLDAKISHMDNNIKVYHQFIGIHDMNKYNYLVGSFVNDDDQLKYKYIFNIQANVQAFTFSNELKKQSVILNVESDYHLWFDPLLKNNKHLITIKSDYSNLLENIQYLKNNDDQAKKIALTGYKFSKRYINKKMISTYWFYYMFNINKNTK
jgi:hypothetical protein